MYPNFEQVSRDEIKRNDAYHRIDLTLSGDKNAVQQETACCPSSYVGRLVNYARVESSSQVEGLK